MSSSSEIHSESTKLTHQAELGRAEDLQQVHKELQTDMNKYSASDYGKLLTSMQQQNKSDIKANEHLPTLEFYDSSNKGVPDSATADYRDGTVMTANGKSSETPGDGNFH
jgi:hypothetical protein